VAGFAAAQLHPSMAASSCNATGVSYVMLVHGRIDGGGREEDDSLKHM